MRREQQNGTNQVTEIGSVGSWGKQRNVLHFVIPPFQSGFLVLMSMVSLLSLEQDGDSLDPDELDLRACEYESPNSLDSMGTGLTPARPIKRPTTLSEREPTRHPRIFFAAMIFLLLTFDYSACPRNRAFISVFLSIACFPQQLAQHDILGAFHTGGVIWSSH